MTSREAFEKWMRHTRPDISLAFNGVDGFYLDTSAEIRWQAWQEAKRHHTTSTEPWVKRKRQDNAETLVNRLRGLYGMAVEPYPMTELHYEAAREIERLRQALAARDQMLTKEKEMQG